MEAVKVFIPRGNRNFSTLLPRRLVNVSLFKFTSFVFCVFAVDLTIAHSIQNADGIQPRFGSQTIPIKEGIVERGAWTRWYVCFLYCRASTKLQKCVRKTLGISLRMNCFDNNTPT